MYPPVLLGGSSGYRDKTDFRIQLFQTPVNTGGHKEMRFSVFISNANIAGVFPGMNKGIIQIAGKENHKLP
jgi:hypothetical protein